MGLVHKGLVISIGREVYVELLTLWLFGIEVTRLAPADEADAVLGSLASAQSGSVALSPYDGPALQPYGALRRGRLELGLAPGVSVRRDVSAAGDGSSAAAAVVQWRGELRARWAGEVGLTGLDASLSGGRATLEGELLTTGPTVLTLAPTLGARAALGEHLGVVGRLRVPVRLSSGSTIASLGGGLALEWQL